MAIDLHMVVDVDPGFFPLGVLIGLSRKGLKGRFINGFIEFFTCGIELLEPTIVELGEFLTDRFVQFCQAEESMISEGCQDPALSHKDSGFHLGLVPGFSWPCGNDGGAVVFSQVLVGRVDVRLIAAGVGYPRFQIIRDEDVGYATEELEGMDVGSYPGG